MGTGFISRVKRLAHEANHPPPSNAEVKKELNYEGRTESHEQLFFAYELGTAKESAVVDGTICCVILECLVTSVACIT